MKEWGGSGESGKSGKSGDSGEWSETSISDESMTVLNCVAEVPMGAFTEVSLHYRLRCPLGRFFKPKNVQK